MNMMDRVRLILYIAFRFFFLPSRTILYTWLTFFVKCTKDEMILLAIIVSK